uniref:Pheromone receptor n=1 Tax=Cyclocybe aegerita TaxID=1973307 RepID=A0A3Q8EB85_CYCAE|nr:pheromone receptor [Cyclocybe aegerita]
MTRVELPIGAFLAATLVLVPLPWHWRARNVPTLSIIAWLFFSNVIYGVNVIIWAGNVKIVVPVWCDITTKLQIGATMALPACCLCLCMHLERIASVRQVGMSVKDKRRRMIFDGLMCWGIPIIYMALHYIVQGHRYDIVEDLGCRPSIYNSVQSILIVWLPPLILVTLTLVYSGLALFHFLQRRITFARHLQSSNSALTTSRYFRLMAMATVQMFWGALLISINMWFTCRAGLRPWISWEDVHYNFSRVGLFPQMLIPKEVLRWTYFSWWSIPASSVLFFMFFAFGQDAVKEYKACFDWVLRVIFRHAASDSKTKYPISPNVQHVKFQKESSTTSSQTLQAKANFKKTFDLELSPQKNSFTDASSIYTSTTDVPSTAWSDTFSTTTLTCEHHQIDHSLRAPRYEAV